MGQFGLTIYAPASTQLGSHDTKVSGVPAAGVWTTIGTNVTLTPAVDERVEITSVTGDLADDNGVGLPQIRLGYTTQAAGGSEASERVIVSYTVSNGDTKCTSNTFTGGTETPSPTYEGPVGSEITVRFKHYLSAGVTTTLCSRNRRVNGRLTRVINNQMDGQFRGSF